MAKENNLPEYWVVKADQSNPDWRKVIDYLNKTYRKNWYSGTDNAYYGYDGNLTHKGTNVCSSLSDFKNNSTLLTIEQFVEMTEGFVLPEKWYCKPTNEEDAFILGKYFDDKQCGQLTKPNFYQTAIKRILDVGLSNNKHGFGGYTMYTEITFEQFKKYVMKSQNEIPEYVECTESASDAFTVGRIYNFPNPIDNQLNKRRIKILNGSMWSFKPSTKEAFDKQNSKKETMKTITHTQAQEIIDVACSQWKNELFEKWGKSIVLRKAIAITELEYQEMRKACTSEQNQLFDEIFGKDEPKYKVGDWITYEGSSGYLGKTNQIKSFTDDGGAIDEKGEFRDLKSGYRLATPEEIQKVKYKIGDWVVPLLESGVEHYHDRKTNTAYQIHELTSYGVRVFNEKGEDDNNGFMDFEDVRHATEEEIKKAKYIPYGTPCLVRDRDSDSWRLGYSNGNGTFRTCATNMAWRQVQVLDMNNLPKY